MNLDDSMPGETRPVFLGVCDSAVRRHPFMDFMGVSCFAAATLYPCNLEPFVLLLAWPIQLVDTEASIEIVGQDDERIHGAQNVSIPSFRAGDLRNPGAPHADDPDQGTYRLDAKRATQSALRFAVSPDASHFIFPLPCPPVVLTKPGVVRVNFKSGDETYPIGSFAMGHVSSPPLTAEERRALLSSPATFKTLQIKITCPHCGESQQFYESLDPARDAIDEELQSALHLEACSGHWKCSCSRLEVDLDMLKKSMPYHFRHMSPHTSDQRIAGVALYQNQRLASIATQFRQLIATAQREEEVQQFLQTHHIFWHFLSPKKILHKPRILTHYTADFGVVSSQRVLYLVEIEKPSTKLARKGGGTHSEATHGLDQIRDWRRVVQDHRHALLQELGINPGQVSEVRFVFVAGTDSSEAARLRGNVADDVTILTFEDLAASVTLMQAQLAHI